MATSDLLAELSKETFKPDSDGERKICKCVLKLLNDQSSDVQGLAVKWCVPRLPPAQGTSESLAHSALAPPASLTAARPAAAQPFAARAQGAREGGGGDHGHAGDAGAGGPHDLCLCNAPWGRVCTTHTALCHAGAHRQGGAARHLLDRPEDGRARDATGHGRDGRPAARAQARLWHGS